ncbi:hypothetical protein CMUS01_08196 [Colletotrichum musicola]|uniref:Uncharacterized protein n=1 Tax=Colletotrichum musicola TaxID=2175873 RepID=A0A8H6KDP3_9PEZI|nr:hypothetical protein CMUS01_08196 [Colletotrichum musicola]
MLQRNGEGERAASNVKVDGNGNGTSANDQRQQGEACNSRADLLLWKRWDVEDAVLTTRGSRLESCVLKGRPSEEREFWRQGGKEQRLRAGYLLERGSGDTPPVKDMFRGEKRKREHRPPNTDQSLSTGPATIRGYGTLLTLPPFSLAFALSHRTALPALHHRWCKHRDAPLGPQRRAKNFNTTPPGIQPGGDGGEAKGVGTYLSLNNVSQSPHKKPAKTISPAKPKPSSIQLRLQRQTDWFGPE